MRSRSRDSMYRMHGAGAVGKHGDFHFHGFHDHERVSFLNSLSGLNPDLPHAAGNRGRDGHAIFRERGGFGARCGFDYRRLGEPGRMPALAFGIEGTALTLAECIDRLTLRVEKLEVVTE